jgi:hypothetical protein
MRIGSRAPAIALFINTPSQPISIATAASDAVPTPAVDDHGHGRVLEDDADVVGF